MKLQQGHGLLTVNSYYQWELVNSQVTHLQGFEIRGQRKPTEEMNAVP